MRSLGHRLLSLLLAVTFTANTLVPGHMHGCGAGEAMSMPAASGAAMHHAMAMPSHDAAAPTPASHQHGAPGSQGDCHCVGHACCASGAVVPTVPTFAILWSVLVPRSIETVAGSTPVARPEHLLPLSHAPPAPLA